MARLYDKYVSTLQKAADIGYSIAVLSWDKEVNLPKDGAMHRSRQVATLSGMLHETFTDKRFGTLLNRLNKMKSLSVKEKRNVGLTLEEYEKATKLSQDFVMEKSRVISATYHAWLQARQENNFDLYVEALDKLIQIKRQEAELLGYQDHPYDALLDQFEPHLKTASVENLFEGVKKDLFKLIKKINSKKQVKDDFLKSHYDKDKQWDFGIDILKNIGYNFDRGRQDISPHPFTTSFSPLDVRVTTRINERDMSSMLWSCIHEGGHALYEQGLSPNEYGLPSGGAVSLSIHESQSRLWENNVGRGIHYWEAHYPKLQKVFPKNLSKVSLKKFYKAINKISPNLIRTEADELHYHFHVLIRFEIEKAIMEKKIEANDLKTTWNSMYKKYLGVKVKDDNQGVLQDIHWAHGSMGYFPTYSLGSFYAAQFYKKASEDIKDLEKKLSKGKTKQLLSWLRENIHQHGRMYSADDLCEKVTGEPLKFDYFLDYAKAKYKDIYGF